MQVKLKVLVGKSAGKEIAVPVERFLIGRGDDCHMRPKSEAISRNHCAILVNQEADEVVVRDLNSRNGTFVNGERIGSDTPLNSGDQLLVGRLEFEVVILDRKAEPAAAADGKPTREDTSSLDFDVSEWLEEADKVDKAQKKSDPETRQFKLDETDRIALEKAKEENQPTPQPEESAKKKFVKPEKKGPGKLPAGAKPQAATSREAAADMLKKFFNK